MSYTTIQGEDGLFAEQVREFFARGGKGLNVTLPYKQKAYAMAGVVSERCRKAGAANTLWLADGLLHADNTDGVGLLRDLKPYVTLAGANILILGAGGAARGIIHPLLAEQPHTLCIANRSSRPLNELKSSIAGIECRTLLDLDGQFDLIINATSAGLAGTELLVPASLLRHRPFCYDVLYSLKAPTAFIDFARDRGCPTRDGLGMLVEQAAESFYLWHGVRPDSTPVLHYLKDKTARL